MTNRSALVVQELQVQQHSWSSLVHIAPKCSVLALATCNQRMQQFAPAGISRQQAAQVSRCELHRMSTLGKLCTSLSTLCGFLYLLSNSDEQTTLTEDSAMAAPAAQGGTCH